MILNRWLIMLAVVHSAMSGMHTESHPIDRLPKRILFLICDQLPELRDWYAFVRVFHRHHSIKETFYEDTDHQRLSREKIVRKYLPLSISDKRVSEITKKNRPYVYPEEIDLGLKTAQRENFAKKCELLKEKSQELDADIAELLAQFTGVMALHYQEVENRFESGKITDPVLIPFTLFDFIKAHAYFRKKHHWPSLSEGQIKTPSEIVDSILSECVFASGETLEKGLEFLNFVLSECSQDDMTELFKLNLPTECTILHTLCATGRNSAPCILSVVFDRIAKLPAKAQQEILNKRGDWSINETVQPATTPLHILITREDSNLQRACAALLLQYGADVSIEDGDGMDAAARVEGNSDMLELFQNPYDERWLEPFGIQGKQKPEKS